MNQSPFTDMWKVMREYNLEIVGGTSSEYECIICKNVLVNACNAPCGCRFCVECIKDYLQERKLKCPGQSQLCHVKEIDFDTDIHLNRVINIGVSKLSVKCPNFVCQSQVELNMIDHHLKICNNQPEICPYSILGCDEDKIRKDKVKDHLTMEIHPHSNLLMNWIRQSQNEMKVLRSDIDKLRTDNEELKEKMRSDEENTKRIIENLEKRERDNCSEIEMLNDEMSGLKNSNRMMKEQLKIFKDLLEEHISQSHSKIKSETKEIDILKEKIENQSQEIAKMKEQYQSMKSKLNEIHQQQEQSHEKFNEIPQMNSVKSPETTKPLEIIQIINQINNDYFIWEIDNFSQKVTKAQNRDDQKIFSDPVLTHLNGYKICFSVGIGEGNVLIRLHLMRGHFDDSIRWPFDRDVELSLINQKTGLAFKSISEKCSNYPNDPASQKPKSEINNFAFRFDFGLSLEEILQNPEVCQKDKISIKFCSKSAANPK